MSQLSTTRLIVLNTTVPAQVLTAPSSNILFVTFNRKHLLFIALQLHYEHAQGVRQIVLPQLATLRLFFLKYTSLVFSLNRFFVDPTNFCAIRAMRST